MCSTYAYTSVLCSCTALTAPSFSSSSFTASCIHISRSAYCHGYRMTHRKPSRKCNTIHHSHHGSCCLHFFLTMSCLVTSSVIQFYTRISCSFKHPSSLRLVCFLLCNTPFTYICRLVSVFALPHPLSPASLLMSVQSVSYSQTHPLSLV